MNEIKKGQIWTSGVSSEDIIIIQVNKTEDGIILLVRNNNDLSGTHYNLSEQKLNNFYSLSLRSKCKKCNFINEYVQESNYICFKCKSGF